MKNNFETLAEIIQYTGWSEERLVRMQREENFPMRKIGGRWASSKNAIDEWWDSRVKNGDMPPNQEFLNATS